MSGHVEFVEGICGITNLCTALPSIFSLIPKVYEKVLEKVQHSIGKGTGINGPHVTVSDSVPTYKVEYQMHNWIEWKDFQQLYGI